MAESKPAPGDLELVQAFVNTRDLDEGTDAFATVETLTAWLGEHGLLGQPVSGEETTTAPVPEVDRQLAVRLRESLRELMLANNDGRPLTDETLEALHAAAEGSAIAVRVDAGGALSLDAREAGVRGALSRLLLIVQRAMTEGTWQRLKACRDDTCQWGFYDHSKNQSRAWCSMEVCGARNKAREYRRRHADHDHD